MSVSKRLVAEFIGTAWLVFGGCGAAVLSAAYPNLGIGFAGVALAFGLTVMTMCYAIGHISGCHLNPAVSVGLVAGRRFPVAHLLPYIVAQVLGATTGAAVLYVIASGKPGFILGSFAANGYGAHSPGGYSLLACFVAEVVLTMFFLLVILGATDSRAPQSLAGVAHRTLPDPHPPRRYPGDEHLRESGPQHQPGALRARMGARPTLALLGRSHHWRPHRWRRLPRLLRRSRRSRGSQAEAPACRCRRLDTEPGRHPIASAAPL